LSYYLSTKVIKKRNEEIFKESGIINGMIVKKLKEIDTKIDFISTKILEMERESIK
jgi:hypothetical protein